jgi:hypothetical protein
MGIGYRIEPVAGLFNVVAPWDEIVGRYTSEEEAQQSIELFKKEHAVSETALLLVENAIKGLMQLTGAIRDVMGGA